MVRKWSERKKASKPAGLGRLRHPHLLLVGGALLGLDEDAELHRLQANRARPGRGPAAAAVAGRATRGRLGHGHRRDLPPDRGRAATAAPCAPSGRPSPDLGYTHLAAYDHVLGGDTAVLGDLGGPYTIDDTFREPLTHVRLPGRAAPTWPSPPPSSSGRSARPRCWPSRRPRSTCSAAGRFRLGLGIGWNKLEYDALGVPFEQRGAILEEQVAVLRALWTERSVTVDGRFHHIRAAGLAPLPVQRPIPIWIGAHAPAALRRVGRIADGWFPMVRPGGGLEEALEIIREGAAEAGRDMSNFEFEGRLEYPSATTTRSPSTPGAGEAAGASHLSLNTMHAGLPDVRTPTSPRSRRWSPVLLSP